jgi:hypothetical protein
MPPGFARRFFLGQAFCDQLIGTRFDVEFELGFQIAIQAGATKYVRQT